MDERYGLVQHSKSGDFYAVEFATVPDADGVYHILRASDALPASEVIDESNRKIITEDQIYVALMNTDDAEAQGDWLDQQPGDLW